MDSYVEVVENCEKFAKDFVVCRVIPAHYEATILRFIYASAAKLNIQRKEGETHGSLHKKGVVVVVDIELLCSSTTDNKPCTRSLSYLYL